MGWKPAFYVLTTFSCLSSPAPRAPPAPRTPAPEAVQFSQDDTPADELVSALLRRAGDSAASMTGADWLRLAVELTRADAHVQPEHDAIDRRVLV